MWKSMITKWVAVALVGGAALSLTSGVQAQNPYFQVRPGLTIGQYAYNLATVGQALQNVPPYAYGFNPYVSPFNNPYANPYMNSAYSPVNPYASLYNNMYSNPYYYPYNPDPYGFNGASSMLQAHGQLMLNQQQAYVLREQARQARIQTQRQMFDEMRYEARNTPTPEEQRQQFRTMQLERARNNPPLTEIYSGKALNDLIADIRAQLAKTDSASLRTYQLSLQPEDLKHINLSSGAGNIALLKNDGALNWPVALTAPEFKTERERINQLAKDAVQNAGFNGKVDGGIIRDLVADAAQMQKQLRSEVNDLPLSMYLEAKMFLDNLEDAIRALQQPDVAKHFNGSYALKAKTIPELVKKMDGLQFAPAVPGDEAAYVALHQALAAYDQALAPRVTAQK